MVSNKKIKHETDRPSREISEIPPHLQSLYADQTKEAERMENRDCRHVQKETPLVW